MKMASLTIDPAFRVASVDRRLFGSFVEHMGRCVYTGIYEPDHPRADRDGFRQDVLELVLELGVSVVRYPGGNFVSGYNWEDGVGPREERPTRLDLAWHSVETNEFGLNEFASWARRAEVEPMLAVNLGTRGVDAARSLVEYCNHPGGTYWSDLRIAHGVKEPHGIKLWCLGNEMDGTWQIGHKTADEYGRLAAETAKAMRLVDPTVELVACGSSNRSMPTFGAWEATVLDHAYEYVDFISLHTYYERVDDDLASFLASAADMDAFIGAVVATCDHIGAKKRSTKKLRLSFDEWNVWYMTDYHHREPHDWMPVPNLIEDTFNVSDAVVVGNLLISLLRHADRVGVACQAQLANIIAPIRTERGGPAWRQTIFYPFADAARHARGDVLRIEPRSPRYETKRYGDVPTVDAVATLDRDTGELVLFAVNRDTREPMTLAADLRALPGYRLHEFTMLTGDFAATNTVIDPARVRPVSSSAASVDDESLTATLPPVSWNVLRLRPAGRD
jgi:alpha-N-arabinofuranosidase